MKFYVVAVECAMLQGMALCSASRAMVRKCTVGRENEEEQGEMRKYGKCLHSQPFVVISD